MRKKWLTSTFFIFLLCILLTNTFKAEVFARTTPKIAIVSLDHVPFVAGDKNEFYISAKNYTGQVEYQLFYIQESVMKEWQLINNSDMNDGWTRPIDAQTPAIVNISSLNLEADKYRFAIRVRRVGVKGLKQNSYGDYDDSYPFNLNVVKDANIELSGNINIEETNFIKNGNLVINGVGSPSQDVQYKLHLFDVKNSKWLTDLTEYNTSVNYSLKNIPEGTYIVDLWAKNSNSKNKYDGWKLKVITVQNSLDKATVVKFTDSNLEKVIRELINKPYGYIYKEDVEKIESVEWYFYNDASEPVPEEEMIFNLSGIENLTNLKVMNLEGNSISDLSALSGLANLTEIKLGSNLISDISPLRGLTNLTELWLGNNDLDSNGISALKGLTNLVLVDLSENKISDISTMAGLTKLQYLDLYINDISDISVLEGMINLGALDLYENNISDISALRGMTKLTYLGLGQNNISDISSLSGLTKLMELSLRDNSISDMNALKGMTNLIAFDLGENSISDISAVKGLSNLTQFYLDNNNISDISALKGLTNLISLNLEQNKISDISALAGVTNLESLYLSGNQISNINSLKRLANLMWIELGNNKISDADMKALKNALPEGAEFN